MGVEGSGLFNVIWLKSIHTFTFIVMVFTASASIRVSARNASLYIAVMIFCAQPYLKPCFMCPFYILSTCPSKVLCTALLQKHIVNRHFPECSTNRHWSSCHTSVAKIHYGFNWGCFCFSLSIFTAWENGCVAWEHSNGVNCAGLMLNVLTFLTGQPHKTSIPKQQMSNLSLQLICIKHLVQFHITVTKF